MSDGLLRMPVRERKGAIAEAVRRLNEAGVGIDDIAMSRPTLDDVFLSLTGHAAEQAASEIDGETAVFSGDLTEPGACEQTDQAGQDKGTE